jgi:hypothetical protein
MLRWFAPLLMFAAKPEVMIRLLTIVLAAGILAFGVWLISDIALTVDALKNPYIAAAYGIVLLCFFIGVGAVAWLRLRRLSPPDKLAPPSSPPEPAPLPSEVVTRRAEAMARQWQRANREPTSPRREAPRPAPAAPVQPKPTSAPARATLLVTGPAYTGKTALIAVLAQLSSAHSPETSDLVRLVDAGPADGNERELAALLTSAAAADGVLFVVDQDLRAPEVEAITRLIAAGKPLYLVLNKMDLFNAADRDTILLSIRAKMPDQVLPADVVSVAAAPSPIERQIEDAGGAVRVEMRRPSNDVRALTNLLRRIFPVTAGRTLRFEGESLSRF